MIAWRWPIVALFALLVIPGGYYATKVGQDSSVDRIISADDPAYQETHAFEQVFGGGEYAVLILEADDPFSLPVLERVDALEKELLAIPKLQVSSVLTAYREARAGFTPNEDQAAAVRKFATGTELFRRQGLIGDHFLIVGLVLDVHSRPERDDLLAKIETGIGKVGTGAPLTAFRRVGKPYVNHYFDEATARSGPRYFGLFTLFVVVLVMWLFRSVRTLLAFLATLGVCLALSLGFIGATGGTFTLVSPMVPMTILITATATLVYLHSRFDQRPDDVPVEEHRIFALCNKFLACTASIFAATVGFAALCVSRIGPIRDMGLWVAVGLFLTWIVVFTLFPALQRITNAPTQRKKQAGAPLYERFARWVPGFTYRWRWPLVLGSLLLAAAGAVAVFGAGRFVAPMQPLTEPIEYVSRDVPVYEDYQRARELLPGLSMTHLWLKSRKVGVTMSDPPVLKGLHDLEEALAADPEIGAVIGLPSILRVVKYAGTGSDKWPKSSDGLEDLAGMLEMIMMQAPQAVTRFVDRSLAQTELTVLSHATEHQSFARLEARIREHWDETLRTHPALADLELSIVGIGPLQAKMSRELVPTLTESFALTAGIIFLTFLVVFRSGAARIMTMLPSLFAILVMFLTMRLTAMTLNIATILIASTVLGTSENDQIHFFYHFVEGRKKGTVSEALVHTLLISGRAIFFATIINAGGFMAFAVAEMRPMQQFGVLTALALVLSMIADFTALPAALWLIFRERPDPAPAPACDVAADSG